MKLLLLMSLLSVSSMMALPFSDARREAMFLTDKMAYELNLTYDQYDYVYQINLDYFLNIRNPHDCRGIYWDYRNADLRCILHDWQYTLYKASSYFLTPIKWINSAWHYFVYDHYRKGYHYFAKPHCYNSYLGGNWKHRKQHAPSPYKSHKIRQSAGMRDQYHKGQPFEDKNSPSYQRPGKQNNKQQPSVNRNNRETPNDKTPANRSSQRNTKVEKNKNDQPSMNQRTRTTQKDKVTKTQRTSTHKSPSRTPSQRSSNKREIRR